MYKNKNYQKAVILKVKDVYQEIFKTQVLRKLFLVSTDGF